MKMHDVIWGCRGGYSLAIGSRENGRIIFEIRCDVAEEEYVCGIEIEPHQRKRLIAAINAEHDLQEKLAKLEIAEEIENHSYLAGTHEMCVWIDGLTKRLREEGK